MPIDELQQGAAHLSRGVSIKGSVKFLNELLLEGEVEGTIVSTGTLTIGEQARVRGEIRTKSVNVRGTVEGNIFVTDRCELQANCTVRGDIEAPRLVVSENATSLAAQRSEPGSHSRPDVRLPSRTPVSNAINYATFRSRSPDAMIRVYDDAGNVIPTHEHAGDFKDW